MVYWNVIVFAVVLWALAHWLRQKVRFMAAVLPVETVETLFGESAGWRGIGLAMVLGGVTPGGPVVAFAIGAAALKAGASDPAVLAYVTAWSIFCLNRLLSYELPLMGARFAKRRILLALPLPLILAALVHLA